MEGCSKTSAGGMPSLPDGPLLEILSRVPAKSVCQFKCVSKAWRDLIADPHNRKKLRQPMQGLFVQSSEYSEVISMELVRRSFSFIDLAVRSVPLDIDSCFSFLTEMTRIEAFLLNSCNGLILLGQRQEPSHVLDGYIVCNPTTRQWSAVPPCGCRHGITQTYLSFDPAVAPHFHLVHFEMAVLHVYSSQTGTWSQNPIYEQGLFVEWYQKFVLDVVDQCTFVNGFLHLIAYAYRSDEHHILAVDIQGKVKRMITMPGMADGSQEHYITYFLGQSQGHLHCVALDSWNEKISTWGLQDYDRQEWVLKNSVNSLDVFGRRKEMTEIDVVDIHQDCNVVFFYHRWNRELIAYNMDSKEVSVTATFGEDPKFCFHFARYIPCFSESPALTNKY